MGAHTRLFSDAYTPIQEARHDAHPYGHIPETSVGACT